MSSEPVEHRDHDPIPLWWCQPQQTILDSPGPHPRTLPTVARRASLAHQDYLTCIFTRGAPRSDAPPPFPTLQEDFRAADNTLFQTLSISSVCGGASRRCIIPDIAHAVSIAHRLAGTRTPVSTSAPKMVLSSSRHTVLPRLLSL